jgi:hypothetical protein
MIKKSLFAAFILAVVTTASISCSEDIPDCPSKMCVMAGGWKLVEVVVDGEKENTDLTTYNLRLSMPEPASAESGEFARVQLSGNTDSGSWSIENNETILRLVPGNEPLYTEDWVIESFTPRELKLVINRNTGIKQGPSTIEFLLEPF